MTDAHADTGRPVTEEPDPTGGPRVSRRAFLLGTAGLVAVGGGVVVTSRLLGRPELPPAPAWLPAPEHAAFHQAVLTDAEEVHRSGGRLSAARTAGYAADDVPKARPGTEPGSWRFPGAHAGVVLPIAGVVPREGWTATVAVRNASSGDVTDLAMPDEPPVLFTADGVVLWLLASDTLAVTSFRTEQSISWTLEPGDWPAGAWRRVTIWSRRHDAGLWASLGGFEDRVAAGEPARAAPAAFPPSGTDDGIMLGGSPASLQPFEVADAQIHLGSLTPDDGPPPPATLTLDATATTGPWAPGLSGSLALPAGFGLGTPNDAPEARDRQYELVYDQAGSRLVRFGGPLNYLGITPEEGGGFTYDWSVLDAELDALLLGRPDLLLHLTLDFTPELLQPPDGDHRAPPTDPDAWATIAADVVDHVADRYDDQFGSVTLWNEPDYDVYWTGTDEELYDLWARTQVQLLGRGSTHLLGSPEYAFTPGIVGFFAWLAERPAVLRDSVQAIYVHDFQQDLHEVRQRIADAREAAQAAGVGDVPIRITEYNLALGQIPERRNDEDSWYGTQPPHFTTEYAAAYAVHFLWEALDQDDVDTAVFAAIGTPLLFWGEQGLTTSEGEIRPLPTLGALALLARLRGDRIAATSNRPAVRSFATVDDDGTVMVVYASFRPYRGFVEDVEFALRWSGLPPRYRWERWQLDRRHDDGGREQLVAEGDQDDLPRTVTLGALGVGGIRITPT